MRKKKILYATAPLVTILLLIALGMKSGFNWITWTAIGLNALLVVLRFMGGEDDG